MNPIRTIRRLAWILAVLVTGTLAFAAAASAASAAVATPAPPDPGPAGVVPTPAIQTFATDGMPGWQIIVIAAGAALLAATVAVLLDRARTARRRMTAPTA